MQIILLIVIVIVYDPHSSLRVLVSLVNCQFQLDLMLIHFYLTLFSEGAATFTDLGLCFLQNKNIVGRTAAKLN